MTPSLLSRPLPLFIAIPLFAATTVQPVTEVSAQQAIIRVRTAQASCTHSITEVLSGTTPDDVNASIFSGANLDTRAGSVVNGPDRVFVFGQRAAAQGSDGLIHSRSAKANTAYQDAVTCGADSPVTVNFITGNIQNGGTYLEQPPFCPAGFGNWCWPSINWSNQSVQYADPQTGIVIQRVDSPGWYGVEREPQNFDFAIGGAGYTNAQNILNGSACAGTSATCAQSANSNSIFVAMKGQNYSFAGPGNGNSSGYNTQGVTYDDFLVMLTGKYTGAGGSLVSVCLSYYDSGATCQSASQTITLQTTTSTAGYPANDPGYSAGANHWNAQFQFGEWGGTAPKQSDFGEAWGAASGSSGVTTSGAAVTGHCAASSASWACFNVKWNNAYFYIQGSGCTDGGADICQINGHPADGEHLTLKNAPAAACSTQCNWNSLASGVVITPNGAGTVDIGASYSFAFSSMYEMLAEGDQQVCNPVAVSVGFQADGTTPINPPVPGNLCFIQPQIALNAANGILFLLIPSSGEIRMLDPLYAPQGVDSGDMTGDQNAGQIAFPIAPWDGACGLCLYGVANTNTSGAASLFKATYDTTKNWKAYSHPAWACGACIGGGHAAPGEDPATGNRWTDSPLIYTNISKPSAGLSLQAQIAAHNPTWNTTIWPASGVAADLSRVVVGHALFTLFTNGGYPESLNIFNLSTGLITSWGDTLNTYPMRWCGVHTVFTSSVAPGNFAMVCNYVAANSSGVILGGPFQATPYYVYFSGTPNTNTAITGTSPMEPCSNYTIAAKIQALGATGNICMHIRMKNVTSHTPSAAELALWPSPQNAVWSEPTPLQAGDELALSQYMGTGENDLVAAVTTGVSDSQCSSDCLDVVLARGVPSNNLPVANVNGWSVQAGPTLGSCGQSGGCTPGVGAWIPGNTSGAMASSTIPDPQAFAGHSDGGTGMTDGKMTYVLAGYKARFNLPLASQAGSFDASNQIVEVPPFHGGTISGCAIQSYPSNEQYNASAQERRWFLDYHAMNPSTGVVGEQFVGGICATNYSLVGGTSTVYNVGTPAGGLAVNEANYKSNGLQGWAGHNLLKDVSGPSSSLSDSAAYQTCVALASGECRSGSSAGQVFATVPNVPSIQSGCITSWLVENYPCAGNLPSIAGWLVQHDASNSYSQFENARKMSMGLTGYGRQYAFNTFIPESTGAWGMFKADWADGFRGGIFMAKLPPFAPQNSTPRSTFVNLPVLVPAGAAYAEIKFGYIENGSAQSYFCTSRQDACTTSGSPFAYPSIDSRTLVSCTSGCSINIPAIAGRAVYYTIGFSANGASWTYGAPQVGLVQ
jgi:hypothetical protein